MFLFGPLPTRPKPKKAKSRHRHDYTIAAQQCNLGDYHYTVQRTRKLSCICSTHLPFQVPPPASNPSLEITASSHHNEVRAEVAQFRQAEENQAWKAEIAKLRSDMGAEKREREINARIQMARADAVREVEERTMREREKEKERVMRVEVERERIRLMEIEQERMRLLDAERERMRLIGDGNDPRSMSNSPHHPNHPERSHKTSSGEDLNIQWHVHVSPPPSTRTSRSTSSRAPDNHPYLERSQARDPRQLAAEEEWVMACPSVEELDRLGRRLTRMEGSHALVVEAMERDRERCWERSTREREREFWY